jgi:hypothetical protein
MSKVFLDGIEFLASSDELVDGSLDELYICSDLKGWDSGAPMRGESEDFPNADGTSPLEVVYRSGRPLRFIGAAYSKDSAAVVARMRRRIAALQASGAPVVVAVEDDDLGDTLSVLATIQGVPEVTRKGPRAASVDISLLAYDPVKYGTVRTYTTGLPVGAGGLEYNLFDGGAGGTLYYGVNGDLGRVTLANEGTATVWPTVTVSGGLDLGFFVQKLSTGEVVRYDRVVPDGSTVSIDFRTGEAVVDGVSDASTYLTRYEFFSVMPGESFEVQFNAIGGSTGTPQMDVDISDGYW